MRMPAVLETAVLSALLALALHTAAGSEVVLQPLRADARRGPNLVPNAGFEELAGGRPAGWDNQLAAGFVADTAVAHGGQASLRFTKPDRDTRFWVSRSINLNQTRPTPLVISGWSKAQDVVGDKSADYSVWVDLQYMDGTPLWGQRALFEGGTHDWQYNEHAFVTTQPVRTVTVNVLFRGGYTGTVWFDDIALQELQVEGGAVYDGCSVAVRAPAPPAHQAVTEVASGDGVALGFGAQGDIAAFSVKGKSLLGTAPGGFWVRDVAADGPWVRLGAQPRREGETVELRGTDEALKLRLEATVAPSPTGLDITARLDDLTKTDRALTAYFVLPLPERKWTWHNDIVRSLPVAAGAEYMNAQSWPATGLSSAYPYSSLTAEDVGLSLSVPMDCPRVCRFVYNSSLHVLMVAFDLGLSTETQNFPSSADVRFSLFQHDPQWGFRAATQKYQERHPQFFTQRLKRGGIWMAFSDISKVIGWEDFGFAYDERSATPLEFDNAHDIASFSYVEPMTYHLNMAKEYPRTYEGVMAALAAEEVSGKPARVGWAQLTRRCAAHRADGRLDLVMENASWCDGAVFTLNPDPAIAEDKDCPLNKGHWSYSKAWADKHLLLKSGPRLDGIYIDSMPNWGNVRNYRREHWRTVIVPLTFDRETKAPVLLQIFSTWQFSKWVADDVHARGGVMHGNGGAMWPFFPALLDVTGQETGSVLTDGAMVLARTLLRNKPYSPLMNTRFDKLGAETVREYFNKSLLYCIFPSFFDGDYLKDGKWQHSRYFEQPTMYERERPLYRKYIPILRRMFDAGWEPVTLARATPKEVRVERYGPRGGGEVLLAVYNPSAADVTATLAIDSPALKLATGVTATALVSGAGLTCEQAGQGLSLKVPLAPGTCEVVCLR